MVRRYAYVFTLSAIYCYIYGTLYRKFLSARNVQNAKVQRTPVVTVCSCTDCTFPIFFLICCAANPKGHTEYFDNFFSCRARPSAEANTVREIRTDECSVTPV
jgi:hypothetical protein